MKIEQLALNEEKNYEELKNLLIFCIGNIISVFGTSICTFAFGLYVLKITGSALNFAGTLIFGTLPLIFINPFAGVIVDRFDKKKLVIVMDLLSGILLLIICLISIMQGINLIIIYLTTFLLSVFSTIFGVGIEAAKPNIVSEKRMLNINSVNKIIDSVSYILGPILGGLVFAIIDIKVFLIINSISFIFSAISELFINFRFNSKGIIETTNKKTVNFIKDIKEGFQYLYEKKNIKNLIIIMVSLNFFIGFSITVPLPYIVNDVIRLHSQEFGIIEGAFPVGMIVGALLVKRISEKVLYSKLLKYLSFVLSLCMFMIGIPVISTVFKFNHSLYLIYYFIVMDIFGMIISLIDILIAYLVQKIIPDEFRGRVLSIGISIGKTMLPVALIISGILLNRVPAYVMPMVGSIMLLIVNMLFLRNQSF